MHRKALTYVTKHHKQINSLQQLGTTYCNLTNQLTVPFEEHWNTTKLDQKPKKNTQNNSVSILIKTKNSFSLLAQKQISGKQP